MQPEFTALKGAIHDLANLKQEFEQTRKNVLGKPVYNFLYRWIRAGPSQPNNKVIKLDVSDRKELMRHVETSLVGSPSHLFHFKLFQFKTWEPFVLRTENNGDYV